MKAFGFLTVLLSIAIASGARAQVNSKVLKSVVQSQGGCESFIRYDDDNMYFGITQNAVQIVSIGDPRDSRIISTRAAELDLVRTGDTLWILTPAGIEEWSLSGLQRIAVHPTFNAGRRPANWEYPTAMALYKDQLVISHGLWGLSIFDTVSKKIVHQAPLVQEQAPLLSMATGVAVAGDLAYFSMDDVTMRRPDQKPAFRGIVVYNLATRTTEHNLDNMDAGADALATDGEKLIVSFMGIPIWKYKLSTLRGSVVPEPEQRIWKFGIKGHPIGRASMDEEYYYTCFLEAPETRGGKYTKTSVALDRKSILLD